MRASSFPIAVLLLFTSLHAQEICNNGIDDDADGLVDLNDSTDCACTAATSPDVWIINGDFEGTLCCPASYSMLDCATGWTTPTAATTDFFHQCDYYPSWIPTPPNDGMGIAGGYETNGYREYLSTCLQQPLLAGHTYTLRLKVAAVLADNNSLFITQPIDFGAADLTVYGNTDCNAYTFNYTACLQEIQSTPIGSTTYYPSNTWQTVQVTVQPAVDVVSLQIGGPCVLPPSYGSTQDPDIFYPYYLYDDISIGESDLTIFATGTLCTETMVLHTLPPPGTTLEWYLNGVALPGEADSILYVSGHGFAEGNYQVIAGTDTTCMVASYVVDPPVIPEPVITAYPDGMQCTNYGAVVQWFLNGDEDPFGLGPYIQSEQSGSYTVQVTNDQGCTGTSLPYEFIVTGVPGAEAEGMRVVHEMGSSLVHVRGAQHAFTCDVFDTSGRRLLSSTGTTGQWDLDLGPLPRGIYVLSIAGSTYKVVR